MIDPLRRHLAARCGGRASRREPDGTRSRRCTGRATWTTRRGWRDPGRAARARRPDDGDLPGASAWRRASPRSPAPGDPRRRARPRGHRTARVPTSKPLDSARLVITDSGGIQEDHRSRRPAPDAAHTERPITIAGGTNRLIEDPGDSPRRRGGPRGGRPDPRQPPLWDGRAGERIAAIAASFVARRRSAETREKGAPAAV